MYGSSAFRESEGEKERRRRRRRRRGVGQRKEGREGKKYSKVYQEFMEPKVKARRNGET